MDLSVIIITYNEKELLASCLRSVLATSTDYKFETIVTDSGSTDGTRELMRDEFPNIKFLDNKKNLGFSKGNNVAIKQASGKYILLLNADTEIHVDTLDLSIKYMDAHPDVGAMGCKVILPNGKLDPSARRKFPNPANSFLRLFGLKKFSNYNIEGGIDEQMEVDAIMGAYFFTRAGVIDKVGLLDEEFFMYGEDLDWCYRIKKAGYKIVYYPMASIIHIKYGSSKTVPFKVIAWAHDAMRIFYRKHYAQEHNWFFNQLVYLGIKLRMIFVYILNLFTTKRSVQ
jgi:GT2 family glycosyltransferase